MTIRRKTVSVKSKKKAPAKRRATAHSAPKMPSQRSMFRTLLFALGFVYLGFHAMHGERGIYALFREVRMQESLTQELAQVKADRQRLELRVSHLRDDSLDLDLLDEQTRRMLGGTAPDEMIVFVK